MIVPLSFGGEICWESGASRGSVSAQEALPEGGGLFHLAGGFVEIVAVAPAAGDHCVDGGPVGESAQIAVVDVDVGHDFAGDAVGGGLLVGVV